MNSNSSNAFFAFVVLSNSVYLGVQLEYHAARPHEGFRWCSQRRDPSRVPMTCARSLSNYGVWLALLSESLGASPESGSLRVCDILDHPRELCHSLHGRGLLALGRGRGGELFVGSRVALELVPWAGMLNIGVKLVALIIVFHLSPLRLDVFVVSSSWIELLIDLMTPGTSSRGTNSNFRLMRLIRVGRLFRVVRIMKVVRLFRSLRTLVQSLVGTLKSLAWAMVLLSLIMYIFSILFTDAALDFIIETKEQVEPMTSEQVQHLSEVTLYFGSLYRSFITMPLR